LFPLSIGFENLDAYNNLGLAYQKKGMTERADERFWRDNVLP
jgi:hypothetical protein